MGDIGVAVDPAAPSSPEPITVLVTGFGVRISHYLDEEEQGNTKIWHSLLKTISSMHRI
jgi:hypothetical protein